MKLTEQQEELFQFVKECHGDQKRKYSGEPYYNHLYRVAETVSRLPYSMLYIEIALCHDLFEDTECQNYTLRESLISMNYSSEDANFICRGVKYLTDVYTNEAYPDKNRDTRKIEECIRLGEIPYYAQSIKYADLIDNSESIVSDGKGFAKIYMNEKRHILSVMKNGDFDLYMQCCAIVHNFKASTV